MTNPGVKKRGSPPCDMKNNSSSSSCSAVNSSDTKRLPSVTAVSRKSTIKSLIRKGQPKEPKSHISAPKCSQSDITKQRQEQRFTDETGTIYPKAGDEISALIDKKDWYKGFVHHFSTDSKTLYFIFEGEEEIETRDFPDEVHLIVYCCFCCSFWEDVFNSKVL